MATQGVRNEVVERCLRGLLEHEGYRLNHPLENGAHGADIEARGHDGTWHIEVIGYKRRGFQRSWDFNTAFFGAVARLDEGAVHCVMALPHKFRRGLPTRARLHHMAWHRIGEAFPELEIWLVDTENGRYKRTSWKEWLRE